MSKEPTIKMGTLVKTMLYLSCRSTILSRHTVAVMNAWLKWRANTTAPSFRDTTWQWREFYIWSHDSYTSEAYHPSSRHLEHCFAWRSCLHFLFKIRCHQIDIIKYHQCLRLLLLCPDFCFEYFRIATSPNALTNQEVSLQSFLNPWNRCEQTNREDPWSLVSLILMTQLLLSHIIIKYES